MKLKFTFGKKTIVIIITVVLIISISFTIKPKENPNFFESAINFIFSPVQAVVRWPYDRIKGTINYFSQIKYYAEENEKLRAENLALKEKNRQLENDGAENEKLRDLLNLRKKYETSDAIIADVIARDTSTWFSSFTVNKGEKDGVFKNMTVLTPEGLVGKITQVYERTSKVTTILDVDNAVSAKLTKTGDTLTTKGDMNLMNQELLKVNYITSAIPLSDGDVIETSGIGGIYPKGIFIGTISKIDQDETIMRKYAILKPGAQFNKITEVLLISNPEGVVEE